MNNLRAVAIDVNATLLLRRKVVNQGIFKDLLSFLN